MFRDLKAKLTSTQSDLTNELVLACDTSLYSVLAVLTHCSENGKERPITFVSHPLIPEEKNFSQIEKEGLAIIYGIKNFTCIYLNDISKFVGPQVNQLMLSASKELLQLLHIG